MLVPKKRDCDPPFFLFSSPVFFFGLFVVLLCIFTFLGYLYIFQGAEAALFGFSHRPNSF